MRPCSPGIALLVLAASAGAQHEVWNFETPHVHPLERTPDGARLLAVNTPDQRLEVFDLVGGSPVHAASIPVGLEPVSVRARTASEAWVVNHLSDTISRVDLGTGNAFDLLATDDEPCDVVFAAAKAFVTCSQANTLLVFDLTNLGAEPVRIALEGEDPRALAVSPDGSRVYAAIFESGNGTTILGGGFAGDLPPVFFNPVNASHGPYGGQNPPPNAGGDFVPPMAEGLPDPPPVALIVRSDGAGGWRDDNGADWTSFVSGDDAHLSGRVPGWQLVDHDLAVVATDTLQVSYVGGLMNTDMAVAVHPPSGVVTVVGIEATNEVRFEPNLNGTFVRVVGASVVLGDPVTTSVFDLNPHLDYTVRTLPQELRDVSVGDPRALVWNPAGTRVFVAGMGSNNVVAFDGAGQRVGLPIEVGEGPTGLALDVDANRLYVLNRFEASVSVVDTAADVELARVPFFDPSPPEVRLGRRHLYDTHATSGLGQASCASCHVDARTDKLAWDLGNPAGEMKSSAGQNLAVGPFEDWHPMKGPMLTQTLQDIIGKEPHHWRGDKDGIEEFNAAFTNLLGDDEQLTPEAMQELEDFLATIRYGPNPHRELDNALPLALPLAGHVTTGAHGSPAGQPLPPGDAQRGLELYHPVDPEVQGCATCHALPTGIGSDFRFVRGRFHPFPLGPNGEHHSGLVGLDGFTNRTLKVAQLRNLYERTGFELGAPVSRAGFGFLHDGSVDTLAHFLVPFELTTDQQVADMVAFLLSLSGSGLPAGAVDTPQRPPGTPSLDAHAAIGQQLTLRGGGSDALQLTRLVQLTALADSGEVGLVVKGRRAGERRGFYYVGGAIYQSDRQTELLQQAVLRQGLGPGNELTWTVVPKPGEVRMGVDRDGDGVFDRDELDNGHDPDDPADHPCLFVPDPPTDLQFVALRRHGADLVWQDRSFNEDGFEIQVRRPGQVFTTIATVGRNETTARIGGLEPGLRYQLRLRAFNCTGSAGLQTIFDVPTDAPVERAGPPQGGR